MESGMFRTDSIVVSGAVLQVVTVAVLRETLPLSRHFCGGLYEIVFGTEVVGVVVGVDFSNIVQELFERFSISVVIDERRECLVEFVERLHAREDEVGALETPAHCVGHLDLSECAVEDICVRLDEALHVGVGDELDRERSSILVEKRLHHFIESHANRIGHIVRDRVEI